MPCLGLNTQPPFTFINCVAPRLGFITIPWKKNGFIWLKMRGNCREYKRTLIRFLNTVNFFKKTKLSSLLDPLIYHTVDFCGDLQDQVWVSSYRMSLKARQSVVGCPLSVVTLLQTWILIAWQVSATVQRSHSCIIHSVSFPQSSLDNSFRHYGS